jgi:hypothetical protein
MNSKLACWVNLQYFTDKVSLVVSIKTCIREVQDMNLDRDTGYVDRF